MPAVAPSYRVVEMDEKTFSQFRGWDVGKTRLSMVLDILGSPNLMNSIKEMAWLPLEDGMKITGIER